MALYPYRIIFIRHGETDYNAEGRLQGQRDIPLNGRGRAQASAVGPSLAKRLRADLDRLDTANAFYASPLHRTRETMELARAGMGFEPKRYALADELKELTFGAWEGLTWNEVEARDPAGAQAPAFDDAAWDSVATPHSFNDVDSFRKLIVHSGGDRGTYKGLSWYRKHFRLPVLPAGHRVFIEFEGMRQAGDIFLNGHPVGLYENGVTAYGIDITDALLAAGQENVLAVKVDNSGNYRERAFCAANPKNADGSPCAGSPFEWNANDFNPNHGGINRAVWLQNSPIPSPLAS